MKDLPLDNNLEAGDLDEIVGPKDGLHFRSRLGIVSKLPCARLVESSSLRSE